MLRGLEAFEHDLILDFSDRVHQRSLNLMDPDAFCLYRIVQDIDVFRVEVFHRLNVYEHHDLVVYEVFHQDSCEF